LLHTEQTSPFEKERRKCFVQPFYKEKNILRNNVALIHFLQKHLVFKLK